MARDVNSALALGRGEETERFHRPGYLVNLIGGWIPALDGVQAKLLRGAKVADVGCRAGASTIVLAEAFPLSRLFGFDPDAHSIEMARDLAEQAGVADRIHFEVAAATDYPGSGYELVAHFDCLHDVDDSTATARYVRKTVAPDGTWMIVEPFASELETHLRSVVTEGGFTRFRRATHTRFDLVLEARP
jgi:2-polyprenyl-3-methyl-5-hydroxy-6-metoxy-1,4-benzoquinol methylase